MDLVLNVGLNSIIINSAFEKMNIIESPNLIFPKIELYFNSRNKIGGLNNEDITLNVDFSDNPLVIKKVSFVSTSLKYVFKDDLYYYKFEGFQEDYKSAFLNSSYFNIYKGVPLQAFLMKLFPLIKPPIVPYRYIDNVLLGSMPIIDGLEKIKKIYNVFFARHIIEPIYTLSDKKTFEKNITNFVPKKIVLLNYNLLNKDFLVNESTLSDFRKIKYKDYDILSSIIINKNVSQSLNLNLKTSSDIVFSNRNFNASEFFEEDYELNKEKDLLAFSTQFDIDLQFGDIVTIPDLFGLYVIIKVHHFIQKVSEASYTKIFIRSIY